MYGGRPCHYEKYSNNAAASHAHESELWLAFYILWLVSHKTRFFERLGVGYVEIVERQPDRDWDVIELRLSESQLSKNPELLRVIAQQYGRTCRRYEFVNFSPLTLQMQTVEFNDDQQTFGASILADHMGWMA